MSKPSSEPVSIRILDREYTVGCEPGEYDHLMAAAKLLDSRMREIRGNNRVAALDRIAVLTALNLASELEQHRAQDDDLDRELERTLGDLQGRLDRLLDTPQS